MKRKLLVLLTCIAGITAKGQQTKSITLLNSTYNTPIESASVYNKTSGKGRVSSSDGVVSVVGNTGDSISITHVSYHSIETVFEDLASTLYLNSKVTELDEVLIPQDKEPQFVTLNKIPIKYLDAPVTTNGVSHELMIMRNVSDLGDATKSATGVRPINRYGGFQTFRIRGFNNFVLLNDGVRDERHNLSTSAPSTNLANVERVEVLKGPASVLFGHSALGGIINVVRKKPTADFTGDVRLTYGSFNTYNLSAGVGGPINDKLQYRADFGLSRSDGWRDYGIDTNNGALTLKYTPSDKDLIVFSVQANDDQYDTDTGIPVDEDGSLVAGMDIETRYNDPQDYLKHRRLDFQLRYEHDFNESLKLSNLMSWSDDDINYLSTEWLVFNEAQDSITRAFPFYFNHRTRTFQNQLDLAYSFETGGLSHRAVIGHSMSFLDRKTYGGGVDGPGTGVTVTVQNPVLYQGDIWTYDNNVRVTEEYVSSYYLQDWISITDKFKALVGVRYDKFFGTYYRDQLNPDRSVLEADEQTTVPSSSLTYRGGLVFQPTSEISLFASYSNYFKPSRRVVENIITDPETGEQTNEHRVFDPEKGYQTEGGIKWQRSNELTLTLSTFYILKNNIVERNNEGVYNQIGEADSKGIEVDLQYTPIEGLLIKAGYAYTNARVRSFDSEELQATRAGNRLRYSPEHLANAWVSYSLAEGALKGVGLGVGMNAVGDNYTNSSNTYKLPSYTIFDAAIFYQTKHTRFAFNAYNLADKLYYTDAIYEYQFFPGMKRNYKLSVSYSF